MSHGEWEQNVAQLLEASPDRQRNKLLAALSDEERAEAMSLLDVADLIWEAGHGAPPLEDDPVAAMLGLIADPHYQLSSKALTRARTSAKVKPTDLASRLKQRGWDVTASDVFRWETRATNEVSPALVRAIAEVLHTDPDRLAMDAQARTSSQPTLAHLTAVTSSARFQALTKRLARLEGVTEKMAVSLLESRMLATVHRGDHPDSDQLLASLEALIRALEAGRESDDDA